MPVCDALTREESDGRNGYSGHTGALELLLGIWCTTAGHNGVATRVHLRGRHTAARAQQTVRARCCAVRTGTAAADAWRVGRHNTRLGEEDVEFREPCHERVRKAMVAFIQASVAGVILDLLNTVLSILACVIYVLDTYPAFDDHTHVRTTGGGSWCRWGQH